MSKRAVLCADDRVALVAELVKIPIVHPDILRKLELADEACADHERRDAALLSVLGRAFGQRRPVGAAAPNHLAPVHVRGGVARIHPPDVRAERARHNPAGPVCVVEVVVAQRVRAELWIISDPAQAPAERRSAIGPSAWRLPVPAPPASRRALSENRETRRRAPPSADRHITAVARKNLRLRQSGGRTFFVRIAEYEFAWLQRWAGSGRWLFAGTLDDRLRKPIAIAKVFVGVIERRSRLQIERR